MKRALANTMFTAIYFYRQDDVLLLVIIVSSIGEDFHHFIVWIGCPGNPAMNEGRVFITFISGSEFELKFKKELLKFS